MPAPRMLVPAGAVPLPAAAPQSLKRPRDDGPPPRFDAATEAKLDRWVDAKRRKEFATADAIRDELRRQGIEPDAARGDYPGQYV